MRSISTLRTVAAVALCCMAVGGGLKLAHAGSEARAAVYSADQSPVRPSRADRDFMRTAARWDFAAIEAGLLAERRGETAGVKAFAARMVAELSRANDRLLSLAQILKVTLPTEPSDAARRGLRRLARRLH